MKILRFNQFLNEGIFVFHGSDRKFDKFDLSKIGTGSGKSKGGWGIYFSNDKNVSRQYTTRNGFVKSYEIKDGNYFDFDEPIDIDSSFIRNLKKYGVSQHDIEELQTDYIDYSDTTNRQLYEWLSYILGSEKNASLFLSELGYIGNKFQDKTNPDATNYVLYDTEYIKDVEEDEDY